MAPFLFCRRQGQNLNNITRFYLKFHSYFHIDKKWQNVSDIQNSILLFYPHNPPILTTFLYTHYDYFSRFYRALRTINFLSTLKRGVQ